MSKLCIFLLYVKVVKVSQITKILDTIVTVKVYFRACQNCYFSTGLQLFLITYCPINYKPYNKTFY